MRKYAPECLRQIMLFTRNIPEHRLNANISHLSCPLPCYSTVLLTALRTLLLRVFAGVVLVGIRPDFTLLDERQNAGKMEKSDAFYPSGFTNRDRSDKIFGRPFVELCPCAAGIKLVSAFGCANPNRQITVPVGHELGCPMRRGTAAAIKRVGVRWQCWTDVHKCILPLLLGNLLRISPRNSRRRRMRSAMMWPCLTLSFSGRVWV